MIFDEQLAAHIAGLLIKVNAIRVKTQNSFTWASGWKSPVYCDNRILLSDVEARIVVRDAFSRLILEKFPDCTAISGVATAGIAHGVLVADVLDKPFSYVRSKPKEHGRKNQIEGSIEADAKVVVIEDLISTGGSTLKAIDALEAEGVNVIGAAAIFSYGFEKAKDAFTAKGTTYYTLSNYNSLISMLQQEGRITQEEQNKLNSWRLDPANWSA